MRKTILVIIVLSLWPTLVLAGINEDLCNAAKRGDLPGVKHLLVEGADVNAKNNNGSTALMVASAMGYQKIVDLLIKAGVN